MKNKILRSLIRGRIIRDFFKHYKLKKLINSSNFSDKDYLVSLGKIYLGYEMNLENPKTFNEKLNWYKINYCSDLMKSVVDKSKVKKYLSEKKLDYIIIPTIKEFDSIDDIKIEELPNEFVIKNSMDSGGVFVCKNKDNISIDNIKQKLKKYINNEFVCGKHWAREYAYTYGVNKIIVEELLHTTDGHAPWDYKFFCFNGEPKALFVATERDTNVKLDFYDIDFNWLSFWRGHKNNKKFRPTKPKNYEKMIEICRILSKDFPFVRVDLYNIDGDIKFGELTFYPGAGFEAFKPKKWDRIFGDLWDLNIINK